MSTTLKLKKFAFTKHVAQDSNGARILGYVGFTLVIGGHEFTFSNLKVRVNTRGEHTLCAPGRRYKNSDGEPRTSSAFRFDDATYNALRDAIFASPEIVAALGERSSGELKLTA